MCTTTLISTNINDYEDIVDGFYGIIEKLIDKIPTNQAATVLIIIVIVVVFAFILCFISYHYLSYKKRLAELNSKYSKLIYEKDKMIEIKNKEIEDLHKQLSSAGKQSEKKGNRKGGAK